MKLHFGVKKVNINELRLIMSAMLYDFMIIQNDFNDEVENADVNFV